MKNQLLKLCFTISVQHYAPDIPTKENRKCADQGCNGDEGQYKQLGLFSPFVISTIVQNK